MVCDCVRVITEAEFEKEVLQSAIPVVVDFYSDGCHPCAMMAPVLEQLCSESDGSLKFVKIDTMANRKLAIQHNLQAVPTFFVYRTGKIAGQSRGAQNKRQFVNWIQSSLALAE